MVSAAVAFLLCAMPALPNWRLAVAFSWRVWSGTGLYGAGVLADERPYLQQLKRILIEEAPFLLVVLFALAVVVRGRGRLERPVPPLVRAIVALLAVSLAQIGLVARHPYQPRYLVPALALTGLLLVLMLLSARPSGIGRADRTAVVLAVLGFAALQVPRLISRDQQLRAATRCQVASRARAISSGCRVVSYYRGSSPALALFQADLLSEDLFRSRLRALFPDEAFLVADQGLLNFGGPVDPAALAPACVVVHGSPGGPRHPFAPPSTHPFDGLAGLSTAQPVFSCGWEAVFRREAEPE